MYPIVHPGYARARNTSQPYARPWSMPLPNSWIGQTPPHTQPQTTPDARPTGTEENVKIFNVSGLTSAIKQITPTLLIVGIATGAAFAIGSGLINRYVFKGR